MVLQQQRVIGLRLSRRPDCRAQIACGQQGREHLGRGAESANAALEACQQLGGGFAAVVFLAQNFGLAQPRLPPREIPPVPGLLVSRGQAGNGPRIAQGQARAIQITRSHEFFDQQQAQANVPGLGADDVAQIGDGQLAVFRSRLTAQ